MEASALKARGTAPLGERSSRARFADPAFKAVLSVLAGLILLLIVFFFLFLADKARPAFEQFGILGFTFDNDWDVSRSIYGALPLLVGTLITSVVALAIGVPIAVATALFVTEMCPRRLRSPLTILIELLAAVPSVVYGLWGIFVLVPNLKPAEQWFADTFDFLPFVGGTVAGPNYFIAGLILAIMVLPIVSAISREVMTTVPADHKEAALALGATRWEMIRMAVLPYSRRGITGAAMLGLGRAIGETIAVTLVIGNSPIIGKQIFDQGYSLAAVIANEFGEAANNPLHSSALIAAGLVLFVLTLVINGLARAVVVRAEKKERGTAAPTLLGPTEVALTPTPVTGGQA
jgi:phosphate ABC transporter permease protein PstC